jgi:hypothetical protein
MSQIILQGIGTTVELLDRDILIHPIRPGSNGDSLCRSPDQCKGAPSLRVSVVDIEQVSLVPADLRRCGYLAFRFRTPEVEGPPPSPYVVVLFPHDGNGAAQSIQRALKTR